MLSHRPLSKSLFLITISMRYIYMIYPSDGSYAISPGFVKVPIPDHHIDVIYMIYVIYPSDGSYAISPSFVKVPIPDHHIDVIYIYMIYPSDGSYAISPGFVKVPIPDHHIDVHRHDVGALWKLHHRLLKHCDCPIPFSVLPFESGKLRNNRHICNTQSNS